MDVEHATMDKAVESSAAQSALSGVHHTVRLTPQHQLTPATPQHKLTQHLLYKLWGGASVSESVSYGDVQQQVVQPAIVQETVDKYVHRTTTQEVIKHQPVIQKQTQERIVEVPQVQTVERVVRSAQLQIWPCEDSARRLSQFPEKGSARVDLGTLGR